MKKRRGLERAVTPMSPGELKGLPTKALLARLQRLRHCENSLSLSDLTAEEAASATGLILFKDQPAWVAGHAELKAELATREHVGRDR